MASGQQRFEDEDWLGSYLSSSKYGSDPKLNAEPKGPPGLAPAPAKPKLGGFFGSSFKKGVPSPKGAAPAAPADPNQGYNLGAAPSSSRASSRRRSWAAPPGLPGAGGRANPAEAAAARAIAAATAAAANAGSKPSTPSPRQPADSSSSSVFAGNAADSHGALPSPKPTPTPTLPSSSSSGYAIPPPPFPNQDVTAALTIAAAKVVNSASSSSSTGKRGGAAGPPPRPFEPGMSTQSTTEWHSELGENATNFRRKSFSGSGRRVSLDYTDLEAVKERVQQAASLWAVAEDAERESISSTGSQGPGKSQADRGARSAAAQAVAAAKAMQAGGFIPDDDDEEEEDEDEDMVDMETAKEAAKAAAAQQQHHHHQQQQQQQAALAAQASHAAAQQAAPKKGSLIKKWLVFRK